MKRLTVRSEYIDEYDGESASCIVNAVNPNLITSRSDDLNNTSHYPVIDFDFGLRLLPSSTPGHFHLYIDKGLSWEDYKKLLKVLVEVGLVQEGYLGASLQRGFTAVRLPSVTKPEAIFHRTPEENKELDEYAMGELDIEEF